MTSPALLAAHQAPVHAPRLQVLVQWDGANWTDESAYVVDASGTESEDEGTLQPDAVTVTLTLDDTTRRYDRDNTGSPIAAYLTHRGQRVTVSLGYNAELEQIGTFTVDDLETSEADATATLTLVDRVADLMARNVTFGPVSTTTGDVARTILLACGLIEGTDFTVETGDVTCRTAVAVNKPAWQELRALAFAEGGRVYADTTGVIRFISGTSRMAEIAAPVVTLDQNAMAYTVAKPQRRDLINRLILEYEDRNAAGADETVFSIAQAVRIPPGSQVALPLWGMVDVVDSNGGTQHVQGIVSWSVSQVYGRLTMRVAGQDQVRWNDTVPVVFTTIDSMTAYACENHPVFGYSETALTPIAGAPPAPSTPPAANSIYYVWTAGTPAGTLEFYNPAGMGHTYQWAEIRTLVIKGKPVRAAAPYSVVVDDPLAQVDGIAEMKVSNPYLPNQDVALIRGRAMLFALSGQRRRLNPTIDGAPYLHAGTVFAMTSAGVTASYAVMNADWTFSRDGGYAMTVETVAAPTATVQSLDPDTAAAPTDGALTTATDSGPWTWGDIHPLVWGYSEWS